MFSLTFQVVLDPASDGALPLLQSRLLTDARVRRVVYISCGMHSLARDTLLLTQGHGFQLESVQQADMFTHTPHAETVAVFVR